MSSSLPAEAGGAAPSESWRAADTVVDARFRYVHRLQVRFRDLDGLGHVNHVTYLTYVEQARTLYFQQVLGIPVPDDLRWVVATVRCDYLAPLAFAEAVDVGWRLIRLGRSSADYEFELAANGRPVARGATVMVYADPRVGRSLPIPDAMRRSMADFDGLEA